MGLYSKTYQQSMDTKQIPPLNLNLMTLMYCGSTEDFIHKILCWGIHQSRRREVVSLEEMKDVENLRRKGCVCVWRGGGTCQATLSYHVSGCMLH